MGYRNWGNELFSYVNKSASTLHYDSKSDWVLLVEGETDCIFYSRFTNMAVFPIDVPRKEGDSDFDKKIDLCKLQILHLVNTKLSHPNQKHWYGIIDKDYDIKDLKDFINSELRRGGNIYTEIYKNIQNTTANSLETMLIEIMSEKGFETFINQTFNLPNNKYPFSIVEKALLFAFDIGCLRNWRTNNEISGNKEKIKQDFSTVATKSDRYYNFLYLNSSTNEICFYFDFDEKTIKGEQERIKYYTFNLNQSSTLISISNIKKDNCHKNLKKHTYQFNNDKWIICHGHDTFNFIESILKQCYPKKFAAYKYKYGDFEKDILMNYPINVFQKSTIGQWLLSKKKKIMVVKKKTK